MVNQLRFTAFFAAERYLTRLARPLSNPNRTPVRPYLNPRAVRPTNPNQRFHSVNVLATVAAGYCFAPVYTLPRRLVLRKEVIQPQLPLQLPCYDFVPVTGPALGGSSLAVRFPTSGVTSSHDVTGGVYKARERIQRRVADRRLLATPTSCRRVAACNPNYDWLS